MKNFIEELKGFNPIQKSNYVEMRIPIILNIYDSFLILHFYSSENEYIISDDGKTFYEFSKSTKYYLEMFMNNKKEKYQNIKLSNDFIFTKYPDNFNINVALDEFIRFFIDLDNFIMDNNIT